MDPLAVFPPEIIHQIWRHLKPTDLLAARAVAPHWLASISDCPGAWVTDFSHDWTEFLAVKKAVRSWSSKNIRKQTVRNVRGCVFRETTFYLLFDDESLIMFDHLGRAVRKFKGRVYSIHSSQGGLIVSVRPKTNLGPTKSIVAHKSQVKGQKHDKVEYCKHGNPKPPNEGNNQYQWYEEAQKPTLSSLEKEHKSNIAPGLTKYKQNNNVGSSEIVTENDSKQSRVCKTRNVGDVNTTKPVTQTRELSTERHNSCSTNQNTGAISPLTTQQLNYDNSNLTEAHNIHYRHMKCESKHATNPKTLQDSGYHKTEGTNRHCQLLRPNRQNNSEQHKHNDGSLLDQQLSNSEHPPNFDSGMTQTRISSHNYFDQKTTSLDKATTQLHQQDDTTPHRNTTLQQCPKCTTRSRTNKTEHQIAQTNTNSPTISQHNPLICSNAITYHEKVIKSCSTGQQNQMKPNKINYEPGEQSKNHSHFVTYFTDFLMNVTDELPDIAIISAFQNGLLYNQNGHTFIDINQTKFRCERPEFDLRANQIAICSKFMLTVRGMVDKKVGHYDFDLIKHLSTLIDHKPHILQSFKASPMAIPYVVITDKRDPFICVKAEMGHFTKVFVYSNRELIFENIFETHPGTNYFFTDDFFIAAGSKVTVYPLNNFQEDFAVDMDLSRSSIIGKGLLSPLIKNCFAAFNTFENNLEFCHIDGQKQAISKMGALEKIFQIDECFASYGYFMDSENRVHLYHFALD